MQYLYKKPGSEKISVLPLSTNQDTYRAEIRRITAHAKNIPYEFNPLSPPEKHIRVNIER